MMIFMVHTYAFMHAESIGKDGHHHKVDVSQDISVKVRILGLFWRSSRIS